MARNGSIYGKSQTLTIRVSSDLVKKIDQLTSYYQNRSSVIRNIIEGVISYADDETKAFLARRSRPLDYSELSNSIILKKKLP